MNGIAGHPANQARVEGYSEVFAEYPGIKVENEANAGLDPATRRSKPLRLCWQPILIWTAIWTQDGMAEGVWRAIEDAGKSDDHGGDRELRHSFVKQWAGKGWKSAASINPLAVWRMQCTSLFELEGESLKDGSWPGRMATRHVPTKLISSDEIKTVAAEITDKPDFLFCITYSFAGRD